VSEDLVLKTNRRSMPQLARCRGLLLRGMDDKGVCVLVVTDRFAHV
jgi:hypothetical protein